MNEPMSDRVEVIIIILGALSAVVSFFSWEIGL
jgi:hypothetical protein